MKCTRSLMMLWMTAGCSSSTPHGEHHEHGHHGQGFHHRFDDAEKWTQVFDAADRDAWQKPDEVVSALALAPGMIVADLGAGTGYFLSRLSKAVGSEGRVLALDVEPAMVAHMKERALKEQLGNVDARAVDPADPKLEAGSVDRILIVDTWHHIDHRPKYAAKLKDALRSGGSVTIVDFTLESEMGPPKEHRLSAEQVIAELEKGGLVATVVDESLPNQYIIRASAR